MSHRSHSVDLLHVVHERTMLSKSLMLHSHEADACGWLAGKNDVENDNAERSKRKDMDSVERAEARFGPKRSESDSRSSSQRDGVPPTKQRSWHLWQTNHEFERVIYLYTSVV